MFASWRRSRQCPAIRTEPSPAQQSTAAGAAAAGGARRPHREVIAAGLLALALLLALAGLAWLGLAYLRLSAGLPSYRWLANYQPPIESRLYSATGAPLAHYAAEARLFVPMSAMPRRVIDAFLAAEDASFYSNPGIDIDAILRAAATDLFERRRGERPIGASTITQQVVKQFLTGAQMSLRRKIREAILALRITRALGKDRVLELYLNQIYLGENVYGVAAASLRYFAASLDDLTLAQAATLAALPKSPANYDPVRHPAAAKARRDWVIRRMRADGFVGAQAAARALGAPLDVRRARVADAADARAFTEEVRRQIVTRFGAAALYTGGLVVRTTLDQRYQKIALTALRAGLAAYDERHGWRGPLGHIARGRRGEGALASALARFAPPPKPWQLAVVTRVGAKAAVILTEGGARGRIPLALMAWARPCLPDQRLGPPLRRPADVLRAGDVVVVSAADDGERAAAATQLFALRQIPDVNGALVALDPRTGRVLALVGGFAYGPGGSEFDRATQAWRQPGSAFKPFVYLAALESGLTPSTIVSDGPLALPLGKGLGLWRPVDYEHTYLGLRPMSVGLELSRNLMTVRLAERAGMARVAALARRFGVVDAMEPVLANALGAAPTTLLRLTTAYAMLDNGGHALSPIFIDRIEDRYGRTIYRSDRRPCPACANVAWRGQAVPEIGGVQASLAPPAQLFELVTMMQGVIAHGTAEAAQTLDRPLAGKTGTTNDSKDAWFVGFTPSLAVGVYVGFDEPRTLGARETGATAALPIFDAFVKRALDHVPAQPFATPPKVELVRVRRSDGLVPCGDARDVDWEAFPPGKVPADACSTDAAAAQAPGETTAANASAAVLGTGGIY